MFDLLFKFFNETVFSGTTSYSWLYTMTFQIGGQNIALKQLLCFYCTLISTAVIVVLCCLFVWKIIKLIGGLIR